MVIIRREERVDRKSRVMINKANNMSLMISLNKRINNNNIRNNNGTVSKINKSNRSSKYPQNKTTITIMMNRLMLNTIT